MAMGQGPYFLLMPSLTKHQTLYGENIHSLKLHEFILSDNGELFIPVVSCLERAYGSDTGEMRHQTMVAVGVFPPLLTSGEIARVKAHSTLVQEYFELIDEYNDKRFRSPGLATQLANLTTALVRGGAHGGEGGEEYDSGAIANQGITTFAEFWATYPKEQQQKAYSDYPDLEEWLGRLMRPASAEYRDVYYCVEIIAGRLDPIVSACQRNETAIVELKEKIDAKGQLVTEAMKEADYPVLMDPAAHQPKVLRQIFQLPLEHQKEIFQHTASKDTLLYALEHEPLALPQYFDLLDGPAKERMVAARFENNETALIRAAKAGGTESVALLLEAGAEIEDQDINMSNALHWAAYNGHNEVVELLIEENAPINAKGAGGNTALTFAAAQGHVDVVATLLKHGADITVRNLHGENALDIAERNPKLIEPLLLNAITLNFEQQQSFVSNVDGGRHFDVMTYAIARHPHMMKSLLIQAATLSNEEQKSCLLNVEEGAYDNVWLYAMSERPDLLDDLLTATGKMDQYQKGQREMAKFFDIDTHIDLFKEKLKEMERKERTNNRYAPAVKAAKDFIRELIIAKGEFLLNVNPKNLEELSLSKVSLKERCLQAAADARPVLEKHRELAKYIAAFILVVLTFPISVPLLALGVFSLKTDSAQKLDQLKKTINNWDNTVTVDENDSGPEPKDPDVFSGSILVN